jgi:hypothetical protein
MHFRELFPSFAMVSQITWIGPKRPMLEPFTLFPSRLAWLNSGRAWASSGRRKTNPDTRDLELE